MQNKRSSCEYFKKDKCEITGWEVDGPHCNSCASYEEKQRCAVCKEYISDGDEQYHKWDIGQVEDIICYDCRNDETI